MVGIMVDADRPPRCWLTAIEHEAKRFRGPISRAIVGAQPAVASENDRRVG